MKQTKTKLALYAILPVLGLGLLAGTTTASAHGFPMANLTPQEIATKQSTMFEAQATLIGATVAEVKSAWAQGKSLEQLAAEKGVTKEVLKTKMEAQRKAQLTSQLQALVSQGVITQAQADQRLSFVTTQAATNAGKAKGKGHGMKGERGMGGFGRFGF